ncbi:MAG: pyruvate:ferredoxin (flavodoxin) oxidoreductase [Spirochaetes bacterium GWF1_31_7]|nr:MAG: pyruvate:ferredoxin (flavodoxin) oxidoreductase [Spirochaetes bacterium GWE1_32_154]OHD47577.1 MAG: pyruvate:ferredoxin (flavodoxin) oxidoreductase [Spirochaetes bacterium GWE2_31_10]OHD51237.1 MAG: pyruvate:ferredoxin (flavodoxin) oxidoreductase [Spirochaetes bacterium GWF1_31_7]HBI37407.1 pyruvate:ferredoxin (flavodoxin) oxidoreductase [Spirochaetia bacterium]
MATKGKMATIDGNTSAAHVAYAFNEVAAIYPITPSSNMAEYCDAWAAHGRKNLFGETLDLVEMESEAGAAGTVHGALSAGALTTTFTASQGLLLMIPNMFKIAGELLPTVFHVSARSLAAQSLSIFGDHQDVMAVRNTGYAMVAANSVQEVQDLALVSHLATLEANIPFVNFFDGFRTSHEIQKVEMIDYEVMRELLDMKFVEAFRKRAINPEHPTVKVAAQNPDVYFQGRETTNNDYAALPALVQKYMDKVGAKIGREYKLYEYYGAKDADKVIISMGSSCDTIEESINFLNAKKGMKLGLLKVRLYRPFDINLFVDAIPATAKKIAVLDRTKEPGAYGEPLFLDVVAAFQAKGKHDVKIIGGRYGLSSKEFTPSMVLAVYKHLDGKCTHNFTVGIIDDVSNLSLNIDEEIVTEPDGVTRCIFWGLGSDGTVGANKNSIKIIGDNTDMYAQGYFSYDSKKSGGITISHLRFGKSKIQSPYLITSADFIACHNPSYVGRYDMLKEMKPNGKFLLNTSVSTDKVFESFTKEMQETIINKKVKVYAIDALKIAEGAGMGTRINTVMQAAFFKLSGILPEAEAIELMKKAAKKSYEKKGMEIVEMNWKCIDNAASGLSEIKVPASISEVKNAFVSPKLIPDNSSDFDKNIIERLMYLKGDELPVSQMIKDGVVPTGTTKLEKRGISAVVPHWISENCIQCNQCSLVCPHAAVRAKQIRPEELKNKPASFNTLKSTTKDTGLEYKIQVYIEDCTGCGNCVNVCPSKTKALEFRSIFDERNDGQNENVAFFEKIADNVIDGTTLAQFKGTQFKKPLFEFSGACAGCGETPYVKLVTQLFGERMVVANATGCSSIYGGTFPTIPYTVNRNGHGPAWANSLFEDNAEYGMGFRVAIDSNRKQLLTNINKAIELGTTPELSASLKKNIELWKDVTEVATSQSETTQKLLPAAITKASGELKAVLSKILELANYIVDKSVWCFGGDGWAYDIGYGGLDHVLASGKNVNILVVDTEVYSNTGGQASKSTPIGAIARFAEAGKRVGKKDLGLITMSYGYIYVASISLGANMAQTVKAFQEAEAYDGPSIILAYAPCINHGLAKGMGHTIEEEKKAVKCGYFPLYRYNPALKEQGKNPFIYESQDPSEDMMDFLMSETRYKSLKKEFPEIADELYKKAIEDKKARHEYYKKLGAMQ